MNRNITLNTKRLFLLFAVSLLTINAAMAQSSTINTFTMGTGYNGNNNSGGNTFTTFVLENNSGGDLKITEIGNWCETAHNNTTSTLWYTSSSLSGPVTLTTPTWNTIASGTVTGVTGGGVHPVISNVNFVIPDGATYRFAVHTNGPQNNYTLGTGTPNNFTVAGMTMYVGNHQISGQNVGYAATNNPRFYTGYVTFEPAAIPCDDTLEDAVVVGPTTTCPQKQFALAIGLKSGILMSGLSYQWQYSNNGINWSNFTGAPSPQAGGQITDIITDEKWYRCNITCAATGKSFLTPPHKVNISPFYYCYCDINIGTDNGADIGNVTIINSNQLDTIFDKTKLVSGSGVPVFDNGQSAKSYTSYHDSLGWPCLYKDTNYIYHLSQIHSGNTFTQGVAQAYIDYNRDGLYDPNTERILVAALDGTGNPPQIIKASHTVPSNAEIGPTGLRVIISEDTVKGGPCGIIADGGEIEDYIIEICYRPCSGTVKAGTIESTDTSMCTGYDYTLIDTTYEMKRSGFDRSWQISGDNNSWFNINNSLNKDTLKRIFAGQPLYYRVRTICAPTHDTAYSTEYLINSKPAYKCYCYSQATGGLGVDTSDVGGVTIAGHTYNTGGPHLLNAKALMPRTDFTDIQPIEMFTDSAYKFELFHTMPVSEHGDAKITVFMDFNNNHQYDIPDERIFTGFTSIGNHTLVDNVIVPQNAITDVPTGMRVIVNNDVAPNIPSDEACGEYASGETEDYVLIFRKKGTAGISGTEVLTGFNIHPNPTNGKFYVQFNTNADIKEVNIRVTDITGQLIHQQSNEYQGGMFHQEIDMTGKAAGVYLVELRTAEQQLMKKLIIR